MSSLSPPPSPFDATLLEPLWRRTTVVLFLSACVTLALLVADLVTGALPSAELASRALALPLFAGLAAAFWRDRSSKRAVVAYVFSVACADMFLACSFILESHRVGSEIYGTLYPLILLTPLLLSYRPVVSLLLGVVLLVPASIIAAAVSSGAASAVPRVILLCAVAVFAVFMAHGNYWMRRREYESAQELLRANDTIQEAHRQLVQAEKLSALGTLSACIAHELSQPLTLLVGYTTVLSQRIASGAISPDDAKSHVKQLDVMLRAARRMAALTDHLRGFARRSGRPRCTSMNDAVHGALVFVEGELTRGGVALELELSEGDPPLVVADPIELEQVVLNLLTNARDALRGVATPKIRITTRLDGDEVFVEVSDNGPGVPAELRETLFQFFVTSKPAGQGTGLGLWVSQGIVRNLAGNIAVVEASKPGATFRVTLPYAPEKDRLATRSEVPGAGGGDVRTPSTDPVDDEREESSAGATRGPARELEAG